MKMSRQDDRRRIEMAMDELHAFASGTSGDETQEQLAERAQESMNNIINHGVLGETAEKRMDAFMRNHARTGTQLDFAALKIMCIGLWAEGFMTGCAYQRRKITGE